MHARLVLLTALLSTGCGELLGLSDVKRPCDALTCGGACGKVEDGCGGWLECGGCDVGSPTPDAGAPDAGASSCVPEGDQAFCARLGKDCGEVTAADNCGAARTAACGSCPAPLHCGAAVPNVCTCRPARPADRARKVVVAHPFLPGGKAANVWDVLDLSEAGVLTQPNPRMSFTMGRALAGEIVFTPDAELGFVVQEDGSLGVFKLDGAGAPQVLHAAYRSGFQASRVVMSPAGDRVFVLDRGWPASTGGVHSMRVGCDGTLTSEGRMLSARFASSLSLPPSRPGIGFLFAEEVAPSSPTANVHLMGWGTSPVVLGSARAFEAGTSVVVTDAKVTAEGRWALIADSVPRLAVVELLSTNVRSAQVLPLPVAATALVPSPFGNAVLMVFNAGFDQGGLQVLSLDATKPDAPFKNTGQIAYLGNRPQYPVNAVAIERGALRNRVLVTEESGIRQVRFEADGSVTDLGLTEVLTGSEALPGAIGVQP